MAGATIASGFYNSGTSDQTVTNIGSVTAKLNSFGLNISPSLGWFISNNTAVGASLLINPTGEKTSYEGNSGNTFQKDEANHFNIGIGGFVRHYLSADKSFMPFGQVDINAGTSNASTEGFFYGGNGPSAYKETYKGKSTGGFFTNATFLLGATKMLGSQTGLDFFVGYRYEYNKNTFKTTRLRDDGIDGNIDTRSENETTSKFTNHGILLGVGFQVFLSGKK